MTLDDIVISVRAALPDVLVAVDFDGTLAPLVADPQSSRPVSGAIDALTTLARCGAQVAVITGRDADTAVHLGGLDQVPDIVVAGLYGIEVWHAGDLTTPETPAAIGELQRRLPDVLAEHDADPAVWIEDKRLSLVVHARKADDPIAALAPLRRPVDRLAAELGLEVHPGRDVLELRLPGYDKAGALHRLAADHAAEHAAVMYLGDDLGDLPAFAEIARMRAAGRTAWAVAVLSSNVPEVAAAADLCVDSPADAVALLTAIAAD